MGFTNCLSNKIDFTTTVHCISAFQLVERKGKNLRYKRQLTVLYYSVHDQPNPQNDDD